MDSQIRNEENLNLNRFITVLSIDTTYDFTDFCPDLVKLLSRLITGNETKPKPGNLEAQPFQISLLIYSLVHLL